MLPLSVVVIARNEAARLGLCLEAIGGELRDVEAELTVLLNGTSDASERVARAAARRLPVTTRLYAVALGDKSNCWNQYVHQLAPVARIHAFVDGYAAIAPGSLAALATALDRSPHAHAASGLPSGTPSALAQRAAMAREGGLHGSLHAVRQDFLDRVRAEALRLPVGLYRGDGLIGSFAMHDFRPRASPWDPTRVALVPAATWAAPPFAIGQVRRHLRRRVNQARGRLEVAAIQRLIYAGDFGALPEFADAMLLSHLAAEPAARPRWFDVAGRIVLHRLAAWRPPAAAALVPAPIV